MFRCNGKFWIEKIQDLVCDFRMLPCHNMTFENQMNALSRLAIVTAVIIGLLGYNSCALVFLLFALTLIIILYYVQRNNMNKENFKEVDIETCKPYKTKLNIDYSRNTELMKDDKITLPFNNTQYSSNQALAGPANPKTRKAPVVVPPIADLSYWANNEFVNFPSINDHSQSDLYQSGYIPVVQKKQYKSPSIPSPSPSTFPSPAPSVEMYSSNYAREIDFMYEPKFVEDDKKIKEGYNLDQSIDKSLDTPPVGKSKQCIENNRGIIMSDGYDRRNIKYNMPTNYGGGRCNLTDAMKEYNDNLFTQTLQPGVYYKNQVIEPIHANMGVSFTQQFEPTDVNVNGNTVTYTSHDPFLYTPPPKKPEEKRATEYNVYDPRLTGYGTNYRSYIDKLTGQPRFCYDDVDSVRRPNYIVRSNIDHMPLAEKYGTMVDDDTMSSNNDRIREHAQQTILDDTIAYRTDLQNSLLRKRNSEMWQLRVAPLRRDGHSRKC